MHLILNAEKPDDFVLATGETHSVRELAETAFHLAGFDLVWKGTGISETGLDRKSGRTLVEINPEFFRPTEVELLCGNAAKARKVLGWCPKRTFRDIIEEMFRADLAALS